MIYQINYLNEARFCFFGLQLGLFLKKLVPTNDSPQTKCQFLEAISKYLGKRTSLASRDVSEFCICGGKGERASSRNKASSGHAELLNVQQKQLEVWPN